MRHFEFTETEARRNFFEKRVNPLAYIVLGASLVLSFLALSSDPKRFWGIFHTNLLFFLGIAQGGALFYALVKATKGYWSIPILRVIPYSILLLPIITILFFVEWIFGGKYIFPYFDPEQIHHHRFGWLSPSFVFTRDAIILIVMNFLSFRLVGYSLSADGLKIPFIPSPQVSPDVAIRRIHLISKIVLVLFVAGYTIFGWDQAMYLDPHWYSTIFGARFFITMHLTYLATLGFINSFLMTKEDFAQKVGKKYLNNVGTLIFGFCIFWSYLFYAELVVTYMGNIPEFSHWYVERMYSPWRTTFWLEIILVFVIPFLTLLHIPIKTNPKILPFIASLILLGLFLRTYDVVYLQIVKSEGPVLGWTEIVVTVGFISLTYIVSKFYLRKVNSFPIYEAQNF